jgi:hypothetical protein
MGAGAVDQAGPVLRRGGHRIAPAGIGGEQGQRCDTCRRTSSQPLRDEPAHRPADQHRALDLESVEQRLEVGGHAVDR